MSAPSSSTTAADGSVSLPPLMHSKRTAGEEEASSSDVALPNDSDASARRTGAPGATSSANGGDGIAFPPVAGAQPHSHTHATAQHPFTFAALASARALPASLAGAPPAEEQADSQQSHALLAASASLSRFGLGPGSLPPDADSAMPYSPAHAVGSAIDPLAFSHALAKRQQRQQQQAEDPYVAQLQQRRFHLLIRSAPVDAQLQHRRRRRSSAASHAVETGGIGAGSATSSSKSLLHGNGGPGHGQAEPTSASLDAARLLHLGQRRLQQAESARGAAAASARDVARLHKLFGADSGYARKQARERRREEQLAAAVALVRAQHLLPQLASSASARSTLSPRRLRALTGQTQNDQSGEEKQQHELPATERTMSDRQTLEKLHLRQRQIVLHWLTTQQPPQHRFFEHVPHPPALTLQSAERLLSVVRHHDSSLLLGHLRVLEAAGASFPSVARLVRAVEALEAQDCAEGEARERRSLFPFQAEEFDVRTRNQARGAAAPSFGKGAALLRRPLPMSVDFEARARSQMLASSSVGLGNGAATIRLSVDRSELAEHERAVAAVTDADRARLIAYFTSTAPPPSSSSPSAQHASAGTYSVPSELGGGAVEQRALPAECHLFGAAESTVSATPLALSELIVAGGGVDALLADLVRMDQAEQRVFPSFAALQLAIQGAQAARRAENQARKEMLDYFRRGEAMWRERHPQQRSQQPQLQQQVSLSALGAASSSSQGQLSAAPSARALLGAAAASTSASSRRQLHAPESNDNNAGMSSPMRSPRRTNGHAAALSRSASTAVPAAATGGPACRAFLHRSVPPPHVDEPALEQLIDESLSSSARECFATLVRLDGASALSTAPGAGAAASPDDESFRARDLSHLTELLLRENLSAARRQNRALLAAFTDGTATSATSAHSEGKAKETREELLRWLNAPESKLFQPHVLLSSRSLQVLPPGHLNLSSPSLSSASLSASASRAAARGGPGFEALLGTSASEDDAVAILAELGFTVLARGFIADLAAAKRLRAAGASATTTTAAGAATDLSRFASGDELVSAVCIEHALLRRELLRFFRSADAGGTLFRSGAVDPSQLRMEHMARMVQQSGFGSGSELLQALWVLRESVGSGAASSFASMHELLQALQRLSAALASQRACEQADLLSFLTGAAASASVPLLAKDVHPTSADVARLWNLAGDDAPVLVRHLAQTNRGAAAPPPAPAAAGASPRPLHRDRVAASTARFDSVDALCAAVASEAAQMIAQKQEVLLHLLSRQSSLFDERRGGGVQWDPSLTAAPVSPMISLSGDAFAPLPVLQAPAGSLRSNAFHPSAIAAQAQAAGRFSFGTDATRVAEWTGPSFPVPASPVTTVGAAAPSKPHSLSLPLASAAAADEAVVLSPAAVSRLYRQGGAGPETLRALWALELSVSANATTSTNGSATKFRSIDELIAAVQAEHQRQHLQPHAPKGPATLHAGPGSPLSSPRSGRSSGPPSPTMRSRRSSLSSPSLALPLAPPTSSSAPSAASTYSSAAKTKPKVARNNGSTGRSPATSPPPTSGRKLASSASASKVGDSGPVALLPPALPSLDAPLPLSAADKSLVLSFISSPACHLFSLLVSSGRGSELAVRTGDVAAMVRACHGDGSRVLRILKEMDDRGQQFDSFQALAARVADEARSADERAAAAALAAVSSLGVRECDALLQYLSSSSRLLDASFRAELSSRVSKADLLALAEAAVSSSDAESFPSAPLVLEHVLATLRDVDAHGHLHRPPLPALAHLPARGWGSLLEAVSQGRERLEKLRVPLLASVRSAEKQLFTEPLLADALSLSSMGSLQRLSGAGSLVQAHVLALVRALESGARKAKFASLTELEQAVKNAHEAHVAESKEHA